MRNRLEWSLIVVTAFVLIGVFVIWPRLPKLELETEMVRPELEAVADTERRGPTEQERKEFFEMFGVWPDAPEAEKIMLVRLRELGERMDEVVKAGILLTGDRVHPDASKFAHARALAYRFGFDPNKANKTLEQRN